MTPLQLQILLHYYTSSDAYSRRDEAHATSPAVREQRQELINLGLIEPNSGLFGIYGVTDKGVAYIKALQQVPLPVMQWVIPKEGTFQ